MVALFASLVIAAAVSFCEHQPAYSGCRPPAETPPRTASIDTATLREFERLAELNALGSRYANDEGDDVWRLAPFGRAGDCEDRALFFVEEFRRRYPAFAGSIYLVGIGQRRGRIVRLSHMMAVLDTGSQVLVFDPLASRLRTWRDYADFYPGLVAYAPIGAIDGQWRPFTPSA